MSYLILTLFVYGLHKVIHGFFEFFQFDFETFYVQQKDAVKFILKPTVYCNVCMSSFWGTVCYFGLIQGSSVTEWVLHCIISAGLITIINNIIDANNR